MANGPNTNPNPESDIYTAWLVISTVLVAVVTVFVAVKSQHLFGTWLPF